MSASLDPPSPVIVALVRGIIALLLALAAAAPAEAAWKDAAAGADAYAQQRAGSVAFALVDTEGRRHGRRPFAGWYSASLLKPIILGAYLRRPSVRRRALTSAERRLLAPMIRASADDPANRLVVDLGADRVQAFGRRLGLNSLTVVLPTWGSTHITAAGYARFFRALPAAFPDRHRIYARYLLRHAVGSQRWGAGRVDARGWDLLFKGGWRAGRGHGRIVNQAARLECGAKVVTLVVLTDHNPSHDYGTRTVEGVARRLLRPLRRCEAAQ